MLHTKIRDLKPFLDVPETEEYLSLVSFAHSGDGETHHILPESLYPEFADSEWNLVHLRYEDHYKAHELLPFILPEGNRSEMIYAWNQMRGRISGIVIDAERYAELRRMHSETVSTQLRENNPMWRPEVLTKFLGRKRPEHAKLMTGDNNPAKRDGVRKIFSENNAMKLGENKAKFRGANNANYGKPMSEDRKQNLRDMRYGTTQPDEVKSKIRSSLLKNASKSQVEVNGVRYDSVTSAAFNLNVNRHTIQRWIKTGKAVKLSGQAIRVEVEGVKYNSMGSAAKAIGVSVPVLKQMIKHGKVHIIDSEPKNT